MRNLVLIPVLVALASGAGACRSTEETARPDKNPSRVGAPATEPTACEETCSEPAASVAAPAASVDDDVFAGCQQGCSTHLPYTEEQVRLQPGAKQGDFARCPVSRVVFVVNGATPAQPLDGKDVYFCCQPCAERFSKAPEKYKNRLAL